MYLTHFSHIVIKKTIKSYVSMRFRLLHESQKTSFVLNKNYFRHYLVSSYRSILLISVTDIKKILFIVYQYLLSLISNRPLPYFSCRTKKVADVERTFNNAVVYSKDFAAPHCRSFCSINHQRLLLVAFVSSYPYFVVDSFFAAQGTYHTVPYVLRHYRAIIYWVIHECINESILHGSVRAVFIDNCMVQ